VRFQLETVGKPPSHWNCVRNKTLFRGIDDRSDDGSEELLTVSHITGVTRRSEKDVYMFMADSLEGYKRCQPGDLVINTMWAWMGALGISPHHGVVSPSYHVYRPARRGMEPRYFDYLFRTKAYVAEITRNSRGVWTSRLRLYPDVFLDMESLLPPPTEQVAIADFLDRKTAAIDALIEKKERLVALLAE
jgi:type I restriction enzyme, S subunit